uniref:Reverse transcriptase domain-containing protein n=1 Tax=Tanacetum cinerariifolium TaxID=118510 RepID=A0A699K6E3_TANCI|nr:hypothetical protein [Tanacetum cinerariifolium]
MWNRPTLQGLGKRNRTKDLNLCALNETTIMMDSVLPSAPTARGLAILPGTVEASLMLPTTREPKGKIKEFSLALSVELRSFVSTAFSSLIYIVDHGYDVELVDEMESFDVIIGMDWLSKYHADLPGIPPPRQVEFQIKLEPGAAAVARAPYRLALFEMKELSDQLQEPSDKDFIRPSSSPWGAPSKQDHEEHLKLILELLKKEELHAKFSKCKFWIPKVKFIGHVIDRDDENATNPPSIPPTQQAPHTLSTIRLSILKKGEYDIWAMKMKHDLGHTDYPI